MDIPELRSVGMDGLSKLQDVILLALAVWGTWKLSEGGSGTDSVKAQLLFHTRRTSKWYLLCFVTNCVKIKNKLWATMLNTWAFLTSKICLFVIYFLDKVRRSRTTTIPTTKSDFREFVEDLWVKLFRVLLHGQSSYRTAKSSFFLTSDQHEAENFGPKFYHGWIFWQITWNFRFRSPTTISE